MASAPWAAWSPPARLLWVKSLAVSSGLEQLLCPKLRRPLGLAWLQLCSQSNPIAVFFSLLTPFAPVSSLIVPAFPTANTILKTMTLKTGITKERAESRLTSRSLPKTACHVPVTVVYDHRQASNQAALYSLEGKVSTAKTMYRQSAVSYLEEAYTTSWLTARVNYSAISLRSGDIFSLGSVSFWTSSAVQPGATSLRTRPSGVTSMTAISVIIVLTQRGAVSS